MDESEKLKELKEIKYSDDEIIKSWKEGQYKSVSSFYVDIKDNIDYSRQTLRNKLIEKGLYIPNVRKGTIKKEGIDSVISESKIIYEVIFNNLLAGDIKIKDLPKGNKKWVLSESELEQLSKATDPLLPDIHLPEKFEKFFIFAVSIISILLPRLLATLKEIKLKKQENDKRK